MDIEINFTDITMSSCDGEFKKVSEIMDSDDIGKTKWVISTDVFIKSNFGLGCISIDCFYNRKILITQYQSSVDDNIYNPELIALTSWAQEKGWEVPFVENDLARTNKKFWKNFYDSFIVNCDLFEKIYGKRE